MTIVFTGGGTGGHIYPGLAIAERLSAIASSDTRFSGLRLVWIGNEEGMDREIVEKTGLEFFGIPSGKYRRDHSFKNLADMLKVLKGYFAARRILKALKPDLLFSKGGYVSVPPCAAAKRLGIPVFTHESDVSPGLATKLNARFAEKIFVSYADTVARFPEKTRLKLLVSGQPVRRTILEADPQRGRTYVGAHEGEKLLFVVGGSQGARQINEMVEASIDSVSREYFVVHQTGKDNWEGSKLKDDQRYAGRYKAYPYISDELPDILAASALVVSRAGAGGVWEAAALGKPMILVPLAGKSTRGDQVLNAEEFEKAGAAISLFGESATPEILARLLLDLSKDESRLAAMGRASARFAGGDSALFIAQKILERVTTVPPISVR